MILYWTFGSISCIKKKSNFHGVTVYRYIWSFRLLSFTLWMLVLRLYLWTTQPQSLRASKIHINTGITVKHPLDQITHSENKPPVFRIHYYSIMSSSTKIIGKKNYAYCISCIPRKALFICMSKTAYTRELKKHHTQENFLCKLKQLHRLC